MQLAYNTLVAEVLKGGLVWLRKDGTPATDIDTEVPLGWSRVVRDAIKGILVTGTFFWKSHKDELGIRIAHPTEAWYTSPKWTAEVLFPPYPVTNSLGKLVNSPVQRALPYAKAVAEHEMLMLNRDRLNSRPGLFLTVDNRIQSTDGRSKPWSRTIGNEFTETLSTQMDPINQS